MVRVRYANMDLPKVLCAENKPPLREAIAIVHGQYWRRAFEDEFYTMLANGT